MFKVPRFGEGIPPKSLGIVGISRTQHIDFAGSAPGYTGYMYFRMLRDSGFHGRVYPINPKATDIDGVKAYPSVTSVPEPLDLVIIAVPAPAVPQVLEDCVAAKPRNVHICSSGFGETGEAEGKLLENRIHEIALKNGLRVIGPNCMGLHIPSVNMPMFINVELLKGPIAFVSQSGGNAQGLLLQGSRLRCGFSKVISYGNGLTLDATDFLEYLATDPETRIICVYVEGIKDGRRFMEVVREINPIKPVIILKGGLTHSGARAASSHTGSMAGDKKIWEAFFKQTGALKVDSVEEMGEAAMTMLHLRPIVGVRVAVIGTGGGNTVLNGDICSGEELEVPALSPRTIAGFSEFVSLVNQGMANPMDLAFPFGSAENLLKTLELLDVDPMIDAVILTVGHWIYSKKFGLEDLNMASYLIQGMKEFGHKHPDGKPIIVAVSDEEAPGEAERFIRELREAGIVVFPSLPRASRALRRIASYHQFLQKKQKLK